MTALVTRATDTWESFEARRAAVAHRIKAGTLGIWQTLDLFGASTNLRIRDLTARIESLEAKLASDPAATNSKPLRLSLVGDITARRSKDLVDRIKSADPAVPIRLTIDSRGGNLNAAYDLADALSRRKGDTHCHALQDCSSAAVIVMLAARRRTAEPQCHFTLHRPSLARRPSVLAEDRIEGMLDNSAHSMARLLASITGKDAELFRPMLATARGKRLTSAEAVEFGIIHSLRPHKGKRK